MLKERCPVFRPGKAFETGTRQHKTKQFQSEKQAVLDYLHHNIATSSETATALNIWIPSMCRHKRQLEKAGLLVVVGKCSCPITGFPAKLLSTNPEIIEKRQIQLALLM